MSVRIWTTRAMASLTALLAVGPVEGGSFSRVFLNGACTQEASASPTADGGYIVASDPAVNCTFPQRRDPWS